MFIVTLVIGLIILVGVIVSIIMESDKIVAFAGMGVITLTLLGLMATDVYDQVVKYNYSIEAVVIIEEENNKLADSINESVKDYYDLSTDVYNQIESGTLFTMYPEIKSDVTKMQMENITKNQNEIKKAKLDTVESKTRINAYGLGFLIDEE